VIAFLVDHNFNEHIVDGLTRRDPTLEFTHVRDVDLAAAPDQEILEWAAAHRLVLLTHDRKTVPPLAQARVAEGLPMPGVFSSATICRSAKPSTSCSWPLSACCRRSARI
jgi:hypothetical protein